jgi:small GTP-binding protein
VAKISNSKNPFRFSNGITVSTADELIEACVKYPGIGRDHLLNADFQPWLVDIGRADLGEVAESAASSPGSDEDRFEAFVAFSKIANYFAVSRMRKFTILLVGRTGVGKSSTINSLLGQAIAPVGDGAPITANVISYDAVVHGVPCRVIDTPGLCDGKKRNKDYVKRMQDEAAITGIDCMWFVTQLPDTRVRTDEIKAINVITRAFGAKVWNRAVLVLTFADYLSTLERYTEKLAIRPGSIFREIDGAINAAAVSADRPRARDIPVVGVTNDADTTPDGQHWLGELYIATAERMSARGFGSFFSATVDRLYTQKDKLTSRDGTGTGSYISAGKRHNVPAVSHSSRREPGTELSPITAIPTLSPSEISGKIIENSRADESRQRDSSDYATPSSGAGDHRSQAVVFDQSMHNTVHVDRIIIDRVEVLNRTVSTQVQRATGVKAGFRAIAKGATSIAAGCAQIAGAIGQGARVVGLVARRLFGSPI